MKQAYNTDREFKIMARNVKQLLEEQRKTNRLLYMLLCATEDNAHEDDNEVEYYMDGTPRGY